MISLFKKIDSFSERLKSESFFLLIKPSKNIYTNTIERDLVELEIELLINAGFINIEISWSNNELSLIHI